MNKLIKKVNFSNIWKESPNEKEIMVSNFSKYFMPFIRKYNLKKCLDVGCGNGFGATIPLAKIGCKVDSFDFTLSGVNASKKNLINEGLKAKIKKSDMFKKFPYKNNYFDAVFSFQTIFHGKLEQIMFTLSEIKKVLNKNGFFFCSFLRYEDLFFDKDKNLHYIWIKTKNKTFKSWLRQDNIQPHLFYFMSKYFEYNVPHYFFSKNEIKCILKQYFSKVKIKLRMKGTTKVWFVICKN